MKFRPVTWQKPDICYISAGFLDWIINLCFVCVAADAVKYHGVEWHLKFVRANVVMGLAESELNFRNELHLDLCDCLSTIAPSPLSAVIRTDHRVLFFCGEHQEGFNWLSSSPNCASPWTTSQSRSTPTKSITHHVSLTPRQSRATSLAIWS
jgi:hypothetical protein